MSDETKAGYVSFDTHTDAEGALNDAAQGLARAVAEVERLRTENAALREERDRACDKAKGNEYARLMAVDALVDAERATAAAQAENTRLREALKAAARVAEDE